MGTFHGTKTETDRIKRVLTFLRNRGTEGATTREIITVADVCAVNTLISSLRMQGHVIDCTMEGRGRYRYKLVEGTQRKLF